MSFDSSRVTFNPWNDFNGVVMQQGRVQLDSDWNEWLGELVRRIRAGTLDTVGRAVYPAALPNAFLITPQGGSITIGVGRMYVDGLLVENHGLPKPSSGGWVPGNASTSGSASSTQPSWDPYLDELVGQNAIDYSQQPYYPGATTIAPFPTTGGPYLVYLDVWQREVTFLEFPDLIEKAVGVDTTGRQQIAWQVKWLDLSNVSAPGGIVCSTKDSDIGPWSTLIQPSAGRLTTGVVQSAASGPCCLAPNTGYTGMENQLYRVEIHRGGSASSSPHGTFKWSRDDASVATAVTGISQGGTVLTVQSTGKDNVLRFSQNDWVEVTDDWLELNGQHGELHQVALVGDPANTITLSSAVSSTSFPVDANGLTNPSRHTRVVRWDQGGKVYESDGATVWADLNAAGSTGDIPIPPPGKSLILENGVTVSFDLNPSTGSFRTGDYWAFAARATDGTVESLVEAPPLGIHHHYARLALVTPPGTPSDCRIPWPPSSDASCGCSCGCSVVVSPGDLTGDTTLQSIIDRFVTPAMVITAADHGAAGNNIAATITNIVASAPSQMKFDVTVTETDTYFGLTLATIKETLLSQPGLVNLADINSEGGAPAAIAAAALSGGTTSTKASLLLKNLKGGTVIALEAKKAGTDGNLTSVTIANVNQAAGTFDLIASWTKTLQAVTLPTLSSQFADHDLGLSYEVRVAPPSGGAYSVPGAGETYLTGGSSSSPASATLYARANAEVCLMPGVYALAQPLSIRPQHSGLTLKACQPEVWLQADPTRQTEFLQGLITLESADAITLSGLCFPLPVVLFAKAEGKLSGLSAQMLQELRLNPAVLECAVGVRPAGCTNLRIENCTFEFQQQEGLLFEAGILASGSNHGLTVSNNCFHHRTSTAGGTPSNEIQIRVGYLLAPNVSISRLSLDGFVEGEVTPALLQDAAFTGNTFDGLDAPVVILSECGAMSFEENTVTNCYSGVWLIARRRIADATLRTQSSQQPALEDVQQDQVLQAALVFGQGYSLPVNYSNPTSIAVPPVKLALSASPFGDPILSALNRLFQFQTALTTTAASHIYARELDLSFDGLNNKIDASLSNGNAGGPGLFIWGEDEDFNTTVIVNSNKIENNSDPFVPTIAIAQVALCTMTGNLVLNDNNSTVGASLFLTVLSGMAVTGNIFSGNTNLAAPWLSVNTIFS